MLGMTGDEVSYPNRVCYEVLAQRPTNRFVNEELCGTKVRDEDFFKQDGAWPGFCTRI